MSMSPRAQRFARMAAVFSLKRGPASGGGQREPESNRPAGHDGGGRGGCGEVAGGSALCGGAVPFGRHAIWRAPPAFRPIGSGEWPLPAGLARVLQRVLSACDPSSISAVRRIDQVI